MALASGAAVGSYRIIGPLGAGSMGLVYRAQDTKLRREVAISPDSKWVVAATDGEAMSMYPLEGGDPRPIPGLLRNENVLRWSNDGRHVFVTMRGLRTSTPIFRLDLATGHRELWRELSPADAAGVSHLANIHLTPDGRSYAYSYLQALSDLYLVENVR